MDNNYRVLDIERYYRKGVYDHFTKDCKCSVSITNRIDVTALVRKSKETDTKLYINFLYCLAKALNSRDDYKMVYRWQTDEVLVFNKINITHYIFDEASETCTPVYTEYDEDYNEFYTRCVKDIEKAKKLGGYMLDSGNHPNYFDASYIPWISYDSLNVELPDGHLYYQPIINWGRYKEEHGAYLMPVTVRLNHAVADGYLVSKVFFALEEGIRKFCSL